MIPVAAAGYIGKIHIIDFVGRTIAYLFPELDNGGVEPQLQDVPHLFPGLFLIIPQRIDVPWIKYQGFFTDGISTVSQGEPDVRIMEIVG